ncbi:MAG: hypothetical protein NXH82_14865 [Rhodobacteraceae bacterium]|nr:hypothetical protein [Paracoccaceae bacterium]
MFNSLFRRKARRRQGRGVLVLVTGLLVASALVRLASGPGAAIARETAQADDPPQAMAQGQPALDIGAALEAFQQREERLKSRERRVEDRMQALALAERQIDEKLVALEAAESQLRATLAVADNAAENDVARLTTVYENMKPKDAAKLFEEMDPQFAAGFLARMRPDAAAGVMTGLSPAVAYSISVILAGRNANVPIR